MCGDERGEVMNQKKRDEERMDGDMYRIGQSKHHIHVGCYRKGSLAFLRTANTHKSAPTMNGLG